MGSMFEQGFHVQGIVPNNEAIVSLALKEYGTITALIMALGMFWNIFIARFTKLKYIFLTGHHTLYMACMIGIILKVGGFSGPLLINHRFIDIRTCNGNISCIGTTLR